MGWSSMPTLFASKLSSFHDTGKSSLLNAFAGEDRAIVASFSGTTRDAIDCQVTIQGGQQLRLVDTAGIRRRTAVVASPDGVEPLMVKNALRVVRRAQVVIQLIDAQEGLTQQDLR